MNLRSSRHVDSVAATEVLVEVVVAGVELVVENVGHGDQLDRAALGRQGVRRGAGAAAAAAHECHLNHVGLARMNQRDGRLGEGRGRRDQAGGLEKITTRRSRLGIGHGGAPARRRVIGASLGLPCRRHSIFIEHTRPAGPVQAWTEIDHNESEAAQVAFRPYFSWACENVPETTAARRDNSSATEQAAMISASFRESCSLSPQPRRSRLRL